MGAAEDRALFDRLNTEQGRLYLANGRKVDARQQALIDRMAPIAPPGYGFEKSKPTPPSLAALRSAKGSR